MSEQLQFKPDKYLVLKWEDCEQFLETYQYNNLCDVIEAINNGREKIGKNSTNYICVSQRCKSFEQVKQLVLDESNYEDNI